MALATDTTNFVNILAAVFFLDSRSTHGMEGKITKDGQWKPPGVSDYYVKEKENKEKEDNNEKRKNEIGIDADNQKNGARKTFGGRNTVGIGGRKN